MKERVLVLGASGFIGSRVAKALAASDWASPIAASRRAASTPAADMIESLKLDATDPGQVRAAVAGVRHVVNCVAGSTDTIRAGARALFGAASSMPQPPRIVHLSSLAVYGDAEGEVDETSGPTGQLSPYGSSKLDAERSGMTLFPRAVMLRPGIVYGPGSTQWSGRIASLLHARRLGDLGRSGDGHSNLVFIDDVVTAIVRALRTPEVEGKIFNLSLPSPPTWNDYFLLYAKALGAVPVRRITGRRLRIESKLLAPPQKIAEILVGKVAPRLAGLLPQPIPPSLLRLFSQEIRMKVSAAETWLGLQWTPLEQGLATTAEYYRLGASRNR